MKASEALDLLPDTKGCVVILSGGMDSTIAMRMAVEKYEQGYEDIEKEIEDLKKCVWYAQREIERLIKLKDKL